MLKLAPGLIFARDFRLLSPLAEGGMGAVYLAEQLSTGKRRALKVMQGSLVTDERSRARFVDEARVGARIASAHVVEVVGAGVDEATGLPWLAMELLDGEDMATLLRRRGPIPAGEVLALLDQACHALAAAHAAGVVHCDLKPENLFVARPRQAGVPFLVKVLDFGIAKLVREGQTAATVTSAIGTPLWMAPEQASTGAAVTPATDVWALGLIAFALLSGRPYWRTASAEGPAVNVMALLLEAAGGVVEPATIRSLALGGPPLPAGFDPWFARCVARDGWARFNNAAEAFTALERALGAPHAGTPQIGAAPMLPVMKTEAAGPLPAVSAPMAPTARTELAAVAMTAAPAEQLPPAVQRLKLASEPEDVVKRLRALAVRARREGILLANDNLGGALVPGLLGLVFAGLNGWLAVSASNYKALLGAVVIGGGLVGVSVWLVHRRTRRSVGTFLQPTGAYFVRADGGEATLYSWVSLRRVQLVEERMNGVYIGTNVEMDFGGEPLVIKAADLSIAIGLRKKYEALGEAAREAATRGAWSTLECADLLKF
jgi:tRNA A-37 threonylcarbamoyl transferase component Bud32